jgi:flagellar hook-length control protein FliK
MNATPIASQPPIAADLAQLNDSSPTGAQSSKGGGRDFAATLGKVGGKASRQATAGKTHGAGDGGGPWPLPGNDSPLAASAVAAALAAQPAAALNAKSAGAAGEGADISDKDGTANRDAGGVAGTVLRGAPGAALGLLAGAAGADPGVPTAGPLATANGASPTGADAAEAGGAASQGDGTGSQGVPADFARVLGLPDVPPSGQAAPAQNSHATGTPATEHSSRSRPDATAGVGARLAGRVPVPAAATNGSAGADSDKTSMSFAGAPLANDLAPTNGDASSSTALAAVSSAAASVVANSAPPVSGPASQAPDESAAPAAADASQPGGRLAPPPAALSREAAPAAPVAKAKAAATADESDLTAVGAPEKRAHTGGDDTQNSSATTGLAGATPAGIHSASNDVTPMPTLKVAAGVDTPEFGHGLADRVSWMLGNNLNGAKLQVNPSQLGPIEVRIAVQGGHAQVWLTSHSAVTRDALELSSPKLREMLGSQGFGQVSVDISQRSFHDRTPGKQTYEWAPPEPAATASVSQSAARAVHRSDGALDAYA